MHNEAPIILAEWAARTNDETRRVMGVVVTELPAPPYEILRVRQEARDYLSELLTDEEAAACVAADTERVRAIREQEHVHHGEDDGWEAWASAAREYRKDRGNKVILAEYTEAQLTRLHRLIAPEVSLDAACRELGKPSETPISTLRTAEFLVLTGDSKRLQRWLAQRSAQERIAIRKHLEANRCRSRPSK